MPRSWSSSARVRISETSAEQPEPIITPTSKAFDGGHDEPLTPAGILERKLVTPAQWEELTAHALALFARGQAMAAERGLILADTKFEFGLTDSGDLLLIDEVMTPDSSRYWPMDQYAPGGPQPSFDKQFVREYLEHIACNKQPPVPALPDDVVARTRDKYLDAFRRLTGATLA